MELYGPIIGASICWGHSVLQTLDLVDGSLDHCHKLSKSILKMTTDDDPLALALHRHI